MHDPNQQNFGQPPGYPPSNYNPNYQPQPGFNPSYPPPQQGFNSGYPQMQGGDANYFPQQPLPPIGYPGGQEEPIGEVKGFGFTDESIRKGFIRKVYSILMVQLSISLGFIFLFVYHEPTKIWVAQHNEMWWIALIVMIVTMIAMACCESVRRKSPMNFIFLGLFTVAQSFLLGTIATRYYPDEILMAVGITASVCLGLTLFAFQTKWDFTVMGGILFVAVIILMVFGIIAIFIPGKIIRLIYGSVGALIFSIYLIYDTQMMMGGHHKYSISPEEYVFAALNLYLDIVNIFMYILMIIGATRD